MDRVRGYLMESIEKLFESSIWKVRLFVISAVIFGLIGATILFIIASMDIWAVASYVYTTLINHAHPENFHEDIVSRIIGAVDLYLIAVVMLIFSFGLYELFISDIDAASQTEKGSQVLTITSLDQLKDKIAKVVIMVLVVSFFQKVLHMDYKTPLDMLYFSLSIVALSGGLYLLGKVGKH
jgi:uncharacterized membrane protein YqhA